MNTLTAFIRTHKHVIVDEWLSRAEKLPTMASERQIELTPRECDVVRGVVEGRTNREIAHELGLNEQSVKNVLSSVYLKCQVRNRLELALFALRHRLIRMDGRL